MDQNESKAILTRLSSLGKAERRAIIGSYPDRGEMCVIQMTNTSTVAHFAMADRLLKAIWLLNLTTQENYYEW